MRLALPCAPAPAPTAGPAVLTHDARSRSRGGRRGWWRGPGPPDRPTRAAGHGRRRPSFDGRVPTCRQFPRAAAVAVSLPGRWKRVRRVSGSGVVGGWCRSVRLDLAAHPRSLDTTLPGGKVWVWQGGGGPPGPPGAAGLRVPPRNERWARVRGECVPIERRGGTPGPDSLRRDQGDASCRPVTARGPRSAARVDASGGNAFAGPAGRGPRAGPGRRGPATWLRSGGPIPQRSAGTPPGGTRAGSGRRGGTPGSDGIGSHPTAAGPGTARLSRRRPRCRG